MKKQLTILFILIAAHTQLHAQIIFHDINPDTTVNTWNSRRIAPIGSTTSGTGNYFELWWHPLPEVVVTTWNDCELLFNAAGTYPAKLKKGDSITSGNTWLQATYLALCSGANGNWTGDATDKYLGFRFKNNGNWNYAWLKMTVAAGAASFTVKEWAYDNAGNKINAGQTIATSIVSGNYGERIELIIIGHQLRFTNLQDQQYKVSICNTEGRCIRTTIIGREGLVDIQNIPAGLYVVALQTTTEQKNFKIALR